MNTSKLVLALFVSLFIIQIGWSQKTQNRTSTSVSNLIAMNASEEEILEAWESLVLQKQITSYDEAEALLDQTMQVAYLQGNRHLGASITKTAYYNTLTVELGKEIGLGKMALRSGTKSNITEKNFKLKPDARDLQRLAGIGNIDMESQRKLRFNLVEQAQTVLATVPNVSSSKGYKAPITGKNQRQASLPNLFDASDVILSNGSLIEDKEQLNVYLQRLEQAFMVADTNVKTSASQLHNMTLTQQQVAQNEAQLRVKLLKKAATIID